MNEISVRFPVGQVVWAGHPVEDPGVAPHQVQGAVGVDLEQQLPATHLDVDEWISVGGLVVQGRESDLVLHRSLNGIGIAADLVQGAGVSLVECLGERVSGDGMLQEGTAIVAGRHERVPEVGMLVFRSGQDRATREAALGVGEDSARRSYPRAGDVIGDVDRAGSLQRGHVPRPDRGRGVVVGTVEVEEQQPATRRQRQIEVEPCCGGAADLADIGERSVTGPVRPQRVRRQVGQTAEPSNGRRVVGRRDEVDRGPQQLQPPFPDVVWQVRRRDRRHELGVRPHRLG